MSLGINIMHTCADMHTHIHMGIPVHNTHSTPNLYRLRANASVVLMRSQGTTSIPVSLRTKGAAPFSNCEVKSCLSIPLGIDINHNI